MPFHITCSNLVLYRGPVRGGGGGGADPVLVV